MKTPEYRAWDNMIGRCYRKRHESFKNYGARGITVCDEWRNSSGAFLAAVGKRPSKKHSLHRIDGDKGYEPGNVRWATRREQNLHRRLHRKAIKGKSGKYTTFVKGAFQVQVTVLGTRRQKYLGRFKTQEEATRVAMEEVCRQNA